LCGERVLHAVPCGLQELLGHTDGGIYFDQMLVGEGIAAGVVRESGDRVISRK
jgi:hypothetical protein